MTLFELEISPLALNAAGEPLEEVNCVYCTREHRDDLITCGTERFCSWQKKDFPKDVLQNNNQYVQQ